MLKNLRTPITVNRLDKRPSSSKTEMLIIFNHFNCIIDIANQCLGVQGLKKKHIKKGMTTMG